MALVPVGTRRMMVAQSLDAPGMGLDQTSLPGASPANQGSSVSRIPDTSNELPDIPAPKQPEEPAGDGDLSKYISDFLVSLGYPPRRLQEFKSQFVSEQGQAGSGPQITVVLPDQLYGKDARIPRDKIKEFIDGVEQKFDLAYQHYDRKDAKLTLEFISMEEKGRMQAEDTPSSDILDQVYSGKGKSQDNKSRREASTIQELIYASRDDMVARLKDI
jgi:hypothetical protein